MCLREIIFASGQFFPANHSSEHVLHLVASLTISNSIACAMQYRLLNQGVCILKLVSTPYSAIDCSSADHNDCNSFRSPTSSTGNTEVLLCDFDYRIFSLHDKVSLYNCTNDSEFSFRRTLVLKDEKVFRKSWSSTIHS